MARPEAFSAIKQLDPKEAARREAFSIYGLGRPLAYQSIMKLCHPFLDVKQFRPRGTTQFPVGIQYLDGRTLRPEADSHHPPLNALEVIAGAVKTIKEMKDTARRPIEDLPLLGFKLKAPKKGEGPCLLVARIGDVRSDDSVIEGQMLDERVAITEKLVPASTPKSDILLEDICFNVSLGIMPFKSRHAAREIISGLPSNLSAITVRAEGAEPITI